MMAMQALCKAHPELEAEIIDFFELKNNRIFKMQC
jgi:hypothetical protein